MIENSTNSSGKSFRSRVATLLRRWAWRLHESYGDSLQFRTGMDDVVVSRVWVDGVPFVREELLPMVAVDIDAAHRSRLQQYAATRKRDAKGRFVRQRKGKR